MDSSKSTLSNLEKQLRDLESLHKVGWKSGLALCYAWIRLIHLFEQATLETLKEETESAEVLKRIYRTTIENLHAERERLLKELGERTHPREETAPNRRDIDVQTDLNIALLLRSAKKALDQTDALTFLNGVLQQEVGPPQMVLLLSVPHVRRSSVACRRRIRRRYGTANSCVKVKPRIRNWKIV
jgi:hypothetical protein